MSFIRLKHIFIIVFFTCLSIFLSADLSISANYPDDKVSVEDIISLPDDIGEISESFQGEGDSFVVCIRDHHVDPVTQFGISDIIDELNKKFNVSLVCLEGASKKIDTSFYDSLPDGSAKFNVAKYFVEKGVFTGAEFYKITNQQSNIIAVGVENKKFYMEQLESFKYNYDSGQAKLKTYLSDVQTVLDQLKNSVYSDRLNEIDSLSAQYDAKEIQVSDYIYSVLDYSKQLGLDISDYTNLSKFNLLMGKEKSINFDKVTIQREKLISKLSRCLGDEDAKNLTKYNFQLKLGRMSSDDFYNYLYSVYLTTLFLEGNNDIDPYEYRDLMKYINYVVSIKNINLSLILAELSDLSIEVKKMSCENQAQERLIKYDLTVNVLNDLCNLKLTRRLLGYMDGNNFSFDFSNLNDFVTTTASEHSIRVEQDITVSDELYGIIKNNVDFYRLALKRDNAFVENVVNQLEKNNKKTAVLIAGGFHTEGVTDILRRKQISYVVISPSASTEKFDDIYSSRISGIMPSIESLSRFFTQTLGVPVITGDTSTPDRVKWAKRAFASMLGLEAELALYKADNPTWNPFDANKIEQILTEVNQALSSGLYAGEIKYNQLQEIVHQAVIDASMTNFVSFDDAGRGPQLDRAIAQLQTYMGISERLITDLRKMRREGKLKIVDGLPDGIDGHAGKQGIYIKRGSATVDNIVHEILAYFFELNHGEIKKAQEFKDVPRSAFYNPIPNREFGAIRDLAQGVPASQFIRMMVRKIEFDDADVEKHFDTYLSMVEKLVNNMEHDRAGVLLDMLVSSIASIHFSLYDLNDRVTELQELIAKRAIFIHSPSAEPEDKYSVFVNEFVNALKNINNIGDLEAIKKLKNEKLIGVLPELNSSHRKRILNILNISVSHYSANAPAGLKQMIMGELENIHHQIAIDVAMNNFANIDGTIYQIYLDQAMAKLKNEYGDNARLLRNKLEQLRIDKQIKLVDGLPEGIDGHAGKQGIYIKREKASADVIIHEIMAYCFQMNHDEITKMQEAKEIPKEAIKKYKPIPVRFEDAMRDYAAHNMGVDPFVAQLEQILENLSPGNFGFLEKLVDFKNFQLPVIIDKMSLTQRNNLIELVNLKYNEFMAMATFKGSLVTKTQEELLGVYAILQVGRVGENDVVVSRQLSVFKEAVKMLTEYNENVLGKVQEFSKFLPYLIKNVSPDQFAGLKSAVDMKIVELKRLERLRGGLRGSTLDRAIEALKFIQSYLNDESLALKEQTGLNGPLEIEAELKRFKDLMHKLSPSDPDSYHDFKAFIATDLPRLAESLNEIQKDALLTFISEINNMFLNRVPFSGSLQAFINKALMGAMVVIDEDAVPLVLTQHLVLEDVVSIDEVLELFREINQNKHNASPELLRKVIEAKESLGGSIHESDLVKVGELVEEIVKAYGFFIQKRIMPGSPVEQIQDEIINLGVILQRRLDQQVGGTVKLDQLREILTNLNISDESVKKLADFMANDINALLGELNKANYDKLMDLLRSEYDRFINMAILSKTSPIRGMQTELKAMLDFLSDQENNVAINVAQPVQPLSKLDELNDILSNLDVSSESAKKLDQFLSVDFPNLLDKVKADEIEKLRNLLKEKQDQFFDKATYPGSPLLGIVDSLGTMLAVLNRDAYSIRQEDQKQLGEFSEDQVRYITALVYAMDGNIAEAVAIFQGEKEVGALTPEIAEKYLKAREEYKTSTYAGNTSFYRNRQLLNKNIKDNPQLPKLYFGSSPSSIMNGLKQVGVVKKLRDLSKQEIIDHNMKQLQSEQFYKVLYTESMGGNAGAGYAAVNMLMDLDGRIVVIGNIQNFDQKYLDMIRDGKAYQTTLKVKFTALSSVEGEKYVFVHNDVIPSDITEMFKDIANRLVEVDDANQDILDQARQEVALVEDSAGSSDQKETYKAKTGVDPKVVVLPDVHGEMDMMMDVLLDAGLINKQGVWVGGEAVLVQMGDIIDRGPESLKVHRFLRKLQKQAKEAGGKVVRLLGNHELELIRGVAGLADFKEVDEVSKELIEDIIAGDMQAGFYMHGRVFVHGGLRSEIRSDLEDQIISREGIARDQITESMLVDQMNLILKESVEAKSVMDELIIFGLEVDMTYLVLLKDYATRVLDLSDMTDQMFLDNLEDILEDRKIFDVFANRAAQMKAIRMDDVDIEVLKSWFKSVMNERDDMKETVSNILKVPMERIDETFLMDFIAKANFRNKLFEVPPDRYEDPSQAPDGAVGGIFWVDFDRNLLKSTGSWQVKQVVAHTPEKIRGAQIRWTPGLEIINVDVGMHYDGNQAYLVIEEAGKVFRAVNKNLLNDEWESKIIADYSDGNAMKALGLKAPEVANTTLSDWKRLADDLNIKKVDIGNITINAKFLIIYNMPEGVSAYHFEALDGNLVIVLPTEVYESSIAKEGAYHEAMEVLWSNRLNPDGEEFSPQRLKSSRRVAHILAAVEQVLAFGDVGLLTPYHKNQIKEMSLDQKLELLAEAKEGRAFQHGIVELYFGLQTKKKIQDYEAFLQAEIVRSMLGAEKIKAIEDFLFQIGFQDNKSLYKHIMSVFIDVLYNQNMVTDVGDPMSGLLVVKNSPDGKAFESELSILLIEVLGADMQVQNSSRILEKLSVWFSQVASDVSTIPGAVDARKVDEPVTLFEESI